MANYPENHPDGCMCDTCREIRLNEEMDNTDTETPTIDASNDSTNTTVIVNTPPVDNGGDEWKTMLSSLATRLDRMEEKMNNPVAITVAEPETAEQVVAEPEESAADQQEAETEIASKASRTPKRSLF